MARDHGDALETQGCIVWTQDDRVVLDALVTLPTDVKSLELRRWTLDDAAAAQLEPLLAGCDGRGLRSLRLEDCAVHEAFVGVCTARLAASHVTLTQLRVTRCRQLGMTSLVALSALLTPSLVTLELSSCQLPRQAGILLGQSLQSCTALRTLLLADNNLRDGGLRAVADAVKLAHAARSTQSVVAVALGAASASGVALEQLDVSCNGLSSAGLACLAQLPVRHLRVEGNAIEYGVGELVAASVETLETLEMQRNPLSADAQQQLVRTLFRRRQDAALRHLDVRCCGFADVDARRALLRGVQRAVAAGERCTLASLVVDAVVDAEEDAEGQALHELLAASFPTLQLHVEADAGGRRRTLGDTAAPKPLSASSVNRKLVKVATLSSPMRLNAEQDAMGRDAEASSVQASLEAVAALPQYEEQRPVEPPPRLHARAETASWTPGKPPSVPLQHAEVELIVSKTIACMNQNFEQRLGQLLARMETQQHERTASQVHVLAAKVDACERAMPRLEARLDVLADRVSTSSALVAKLQAGLQQLRSNTPQGVAAELSTPMRVQVETLVDERLERHEQQRQAQVDRRAPAADPRAVVDAVSRHLTQFKREFDAQQTDVLRQFSEGLALDGRRMDERVTQVETQIAGLEGVIQAEQQASLLALEAISEAFGDPTARKAASR